MVSTADHSAIVLSYFDGKTNQLFLMPTEYAYGSLQSPDVIYLGKALVWRLCGCMMRSTTATLRRRRLP